MSTITDMLDDLIAGRVPLSKTMTLFEQFSWQKPRSVSLSELEPAPPTQNSFDEVEADSRLSARQYAQLAAAYRKAVGGQTSAVGSS